MFSKRWRTCLERRCVCRFSVGASGSLARLWARQPASTVPFWRRFGVSTSNVFTSESAVYASLTTLGYLSILHAGRGDDQCSILSDSPFLNLDRWLSFAHLPHWQPRWILEARCWVTRLKMGVLPEVFLLERFYCTHFIKKMDSRLSHGPCGPLFGLVCLR